MENNKSQDPENKLIILYLINAMTTMMDISMSLGQITDFIIEKNIMNHFALSETLADLVERGFLKATPEKTMDDITTRYELTEQGLENLDHLEDNIPRHIRNIILLYIEKNPGKIKKYFEKTAQIFPQENDEYIVKCGVYDEKRSSMLLEISIPVVTREQAKQLQNNWTENYSSLYRKIIEILTV